MDEKSARARNPRIEALRLVAFLVGGVLADLDLGPLSRALVPLVLVAVASLARAAQSPGTSWSSRSARTCRTLARSTLGFYVAQSMFCELWRPPLTQLATASLPYGRARSLPPESSRA